jgi:hypothetical protein
MEIAVNVQINTQSKFAKFLASGANSQQGQAESCDSPESPKPSEMRMYIEMGIGLVAASGLLVMAGWVCYSAHDWISSIQRFQEMI